MFKRRTTQQAADALVECPVCHELVYMSSHAHTEEELRRAIPDRKALLAMRTMPAAQNRKDRRRQRARMGKLLNH